MTERETRTFTTPGGHAVVLKTYLTGREIAAIRGELFKGLKMELSADGSTPALSEVSGEFLIEQERKALDALLVSVDGDTASPVEKLLDLPAVDYEAIVKEVNAIQNPTTP
jgi:hypothetical protein